MEVKDIKPELLTLPELIGIFQIFNGIGQIFEDGLIYKLFAHIAALTTLLNQANIELIEEKRRNG